MRNEITHAGPPDSGLEVLVTLVRLQGISAAMSGGRNPGLAIC